MSQAQTSRDKRYFLVYYAARDGKPQVTVTMLLEGRYILQV